MLSKKTIAIVLTCYYTLICIGLTFTLHFCGGSLESFSSLPSENTCEIVSSKKSCCSEISSSKNDCCDNTIVDLSEVENESLFYKVSFSFQPFYLIFNDSYFLQIPFVFNLKQKFSDFYFQGNSPPLYILYGTYIYYA